LNYAWAMVAIGALMTCVAIGAMFSLAVFLEPMTRDTGWSRAGISSAMTLNFLAMGVAGFGWGALSDRFGTRKVVWLLLVPAALFVRQAPSRAARADALGGKPRVAVADALRSPQFIVLALTFFAA
jgi:MFS family permease